MSSADGTQAGASDGCPRPYGPFVLVRKLAEGGMAEIFLARRRGEDGSERTVVVKRMLASLADLPDFVEMFRDEARLAARLVHPQLVRVEELGQLEGRHYLCMEYLPGEDFSAMVRTASLRGEYVPIPLVLRVLADAARGLHHAHDFRDESGQPLNIVHRDVSPSNLYVTYEGRVKVLDFGVAKTESRRTRTRPGLVKGKYIYMAPEQARGEEVDRRADVFSLGVSLYEALTHVRPFARDDDAQVLHALLKGECQRPRALRPELSAALEAVVLKAMAHAPAQRYASAAQLADALEALMRQEPFPPTPVSLSKYLRMSFGEARYLEMTRVPSIASLGLTGAPASALRASVVFQPSHPALPAVRAPGRRRVAGLVGLVGVGVLLAGGVFWWARTPETSPVPVPPPARVVSPAALETARSPEPAQVPDPAPVTPVFPPEVPAPAEVPAPTEVPVPGRTGRARVSLETADVLRVVARHRARITACFVRYKRELPGYEGDVQVLFTISGSGRATVSIQGPLAERRVGRCLEKQLARLRFPAHREQAVTLRIPLGYSVTP